MNSSLLKKALPHIIAVLVFLIVSVVYCRPALDGKVVRQADVTGYKGMVQQSYEFNEKYGHYPLWTESTFSGMPAYNIYMRGSNITMGWLSYALTFGLPKPISFFFLACICCYILALSLRIDPWIGILTAIAYAWSSYDPVIIVVGHESKMMALGYAPAVFAALILIFRRNYLSGAALLILFISLLVGTQHLQIVYYTLLSIGLLTLAFLVYNWRQGALRSAFVSVAVAVVAGAIGFATYAITLLPVQEYAKETMRGGRTELNNAKNKEEGRDGLSKEYAFGYSYGLGETFTLLVPHIFGGGGDGKVVSDDSKFAEKLSEELSVPEDSGLLYANGYAYWGAQGGTSGTVYLGAVICFLFLFGAIYVKGWQKWWLLSAALFGIVLAWGKNFSAFNYFMFDHFPYYNKFRAPTMALVIPQLAFPVLGALGLQQLLYGGESKEALWKKFKTATIVMGGILVLLTGFYFMADYKGGNDAQIRQQLSNMKLQQLSRGAQPTADMQQQAAQTGNTMIKALENDRQSVFGSDLIRTILLIGIAAALIGLYLKDKIKAVIVLASLILLSSYDLLAVGTRYLNTDTFVDQTDVDAAFNPTAADLQIKKDPEQGFRVFNEMGGPGAQFQQSEESARTSYFHNSIGGYHPAKLGLYQDLIDSQLLKGNMRVYDMLNTKYFIQEDPSTRQPVALVNRTAYGPCWLVRSIRYVADGSDEMRALDSTDTRDTAIIQQKFQGQVKFAPVPDTTASIKLIANRNDTIDYAFSAKTGQFAVFSEIYYARGWDAFIDGKPSDYCRVDYILRGMSVPAGDHRIEFRFEPRSYEMGSTISIFSALIGWIVLIFAGIAEYGKWIKRSKQV